MKKALRRHGSPEAITANGLRSYKAALDELGCQDYPDGIRGRNSGSAKGLERQQAQ